MTKDMGEIKVHVRLTNAIDDALMRRGDLAEAEVRSVERDALVDTGATESVIPEYVFESLGLEVRRRRVARYADGRSEIVDVAGPIVFRLLDREMIGEAMVLGDEILIGQTVMEILDLLADCTNQRVVPAHPGHYPVSRV